jgi:GAF domain-containing protein/nitrogen-specific signal transduction histidine kinase
MEDRDKTKEQLIRELVELRQTVSKLETLEVKRRRTEETLQQRNRELALLNRASRVLTSTLDLDLVLATVLEEARGLLGIAACSVWLIDPATDELVCRQATGPQSEIVRGWQLAPGQGIAGWVAQNDESLIVPDTQADERHFRGVDQQTGIQLRSILTVPLRVTQEVIGVLQVADTEIDHFQTADLTLAKSLAVTAAVAIENAQLYEQAQRRSESLTNLNQASQVIASSLDTKDVLEQIVELAGTVVHSDYTSVVLLDEERRPVRETEHFHHMPPISQRIRYGGVTRYVLSKGRPVVVDVISDDGEMSPPVRRPDGELIKANPVAVRAGIRSFAAVPIQAKGRTMGVLFTHGLRPCAFRGQIPLLTTFANQAAVALENAWLYEQAQQEITERKRVEEALRQRTAQLEALREVGLELTAQLDLDALLHSIVSRAVELLEGTAGGLDLYRPDQDVLELVVSIGLGHTHVNTRLRRDEGIAGKVLETGESLIVDDYSQWPERPDIWAGHPLAAVIGVPVRWGEEFLGVIIVATDTPEAFSSADAELLSLFATQAAIAIRNVRLYEETRQRALEQETVSRVARALNTLDVHDAFPVLVEGLQNLTTCERVDMALLDDSGKHFKMINLEPPFPTLEESPRPFVSGHSTVRSGTMPKPSALESQDRGDRGRPAQEMKTSLPLVARVEDLADGHPRLTADLSAEADLVHKREAKHLLPDKHGLYQAGFRSRVSLPLLVGGEPIGVLNLLGRKPHLFRESQLPALQQIADALASAVENSHLFRAERRQRQEADTLREAALALTTALERDEVIERILAQLQEVVPYDSASVQLLREDQLEIVGGRGFPNLPDLLGIRLPVTADNPNREVVRTRAPFIVEDASAMYAGFRESPHLQTMIRSWLGVPMLVGERLVGMIALDKQEPGFYTEEHARLAEAFTAQAAIAVENAHLFQAEREQRELAEALEEAAAAVSSTLEPDQVLDRILEQVERIVAGDAFNIMLIEDDTVRMVRWRGYKHLNADDKISRVSIPIATYPSLLRMIRTQKSVVISDTADDPDWIPLEGKEWRRSYVAAPIRVRDLIVGLLNVSSTRPGQFDSADARRLEAFAAHAATAIENAQLYRELLNHTEQLEQRVQERTAQLRVQYARLNAILRSTADGIIVTDTQGDIIQTNPVAQSWLNQALSPEDVAELKEAVRNLAREVSAEATNSEAAGEEQPGTMLELTGLDLELKAAPVARKDRTEEPAAVVVAVHDVSHLKALDRMKTRFVSNVSHELRTPITTIKLYVALMQRRPEKWEEYLQPLAEEADRQAHLVEDILQISRIDTGRLEMKPHPTPLNKLIEAVVNNRQVLAQNRGLTLEYHSAESNPVALVDPARMMQVLNNLVENAIRYTMEGGEVTISTRQEEAEGRTWATATVADTGIGIPADELPLVFDRFYRGEKPRSMQISGTGLGLAIVKEIVELHGGRVTVESQEGQGTTFIIWLPLISKR